MGHLGNENTMPGKIQLLKYLVQNFSFTISLIKKSIETTYWLEVHNVTRKANTNCRHISSKSFSYSKQTTQIDCKHPHPLSTKLRWKKCLNQVFTFFKWFRLNTKIRVRMVLLHRHKNKIKRLKNQEHWYSIRRETRCIKWEQWQETRYNICMLFKILVN